MKQSEAKKLKTKLFAFWSRIDPKVREKFNNLNGKTSQYGVPNMLFQKRTSRTNRVLLSWKTLYSNNMSLEHLRTFYGGVCVEFVNEDFLNPSYSENEVYNYLKERIDSDEKISAIVTFRTEDGDSGAAIPRSSYKTFMAKKAMGELDFEFSPIKRNPLVSYKGKGDNSVWEGNTYYSIKGGDQTSIESHTGIKDQLLFNPATDYANEQVCIDMDITMSFFVLHCHDIDEELKDIVVVLKKEAKAYLETRNYDEGNLYEYCINHPTLKFGDGILVDAIQLNPISIQNFKTSGEENSSVICHNEAANKELYYFDSIQNCILSPARPTNLFWSTHLSNMMQQNFNLEEYFEKENERVSKRQELMGNSFGK
jgi:hypothetical protein